MKAIVRIGLAAALAFGALTGTAQAGGGAAIEFGDSYFAPETAGPFSVQDDSREGNWVAAGDPFLRHNVREDSNLFRSGRPNMDESFQEDISAGTWHYYCDIHGTAFGGMGGSISVIPRIMAASETTVDVVWADSVAKTGDAYRVEWRVQGQSNWKIWRKATKKRSLEFGSDADPVVTRADKAYELRVRSFMKKKPKRKSGYSPKVVFITGT